MGSYFPCQLIMPNNFPVDGLFQEYNSRCQQGTTLYGTVHKWVKSTMNDLQEN